MAVVAVYGFETAPGKLTDHLAGATEGLGHLRRLGLQAINLQAIAGTDVGAPRNRTSQVLRHSPASNTPRVAK